MTPLVVFLADNPPLVLAFVSLLVGGLVVLDAALWALVKGADE